MFLVPNFCQVEGQGSLEKSTSNAYRAGACIFMVKAVAWSLFAIITFWTTPCLVLCTQFTWTLMLFFKYKCSPPSGSSLLWTPLLTIVVLQVCLSLTLLRKGTQTIITTGYLQLPPFLSLCFFSLYSTYMHLTYDVWPLFFAYWPLYSTVMIDVTQSGELSILYMIICIKPPTVSST